MTTAIYLAHWLGALVVLAEAFNKLERTNLWACGLTLRERAVVWLKSLAWWALSIGAGGALVTPLMQLERPTLQDAAFVAGFAVLIVRSRLKETHTQPEPEGKPCA